MKKILSSKTSFAHLLIVVIIAFIISALLFMFVIPVLYWFAYGEGAESARIEALPINTFILNWGALILTILISGMSMAYQYKKQNFRYAKSYLMTAIIISLLYLFRIPIADIFIGL